MNYIGKTTLLSGLVIILSLLCGGCAIDGNAIKIQTSKNYVEKTVKTGDFRAVCTSTSIDIEYRQGPRKVEIYAPDNLIEYIEVSVHNGVLTASYNVNRIQIIGSNKTVIKVSAPDVSKFYTTSSGDIDIVTPLSSKSKVEFSTSSSGDISAGSVSAPNVVFCTQSSGDIEVDYLKCTDAKFSTMSSGDIEIDNLEAVSVLATTQSSGDISLSGRCEKAVLSTQSSGDIKASRLKSRNTEAYCMSSGDIECYASDYLKASRMSAGSIGYSGNPKKIDMEKNGIFEID